MRRRTGFDSGSTFYSPRGGPHKSVSTFVIALAFLMGTSPVLAAHDGPGLNNPGFEDGLVDWEVTSDADGVTVVGEDTATETLLVDAKLSSAVDGTIKPLEGVNMLRLATPKQIRESQNRGISGVSQTFTPVSERVPFAVRLFSWEHRGDDKFRFDLRDASGKGFVVEGLRFTLPSGEVMSCPQEKTPCELTLDVGKRGDFIATDWIKFSVVGLPTDGTQVTVDFEVISGENEAHATWAYVDSGNTPPVADFALGPADTWEEGEPLVEGDSFEMVDKSYDPDDPDDRIDSWKWVVRDGSCTNLGSIKDEFSEQNGFYVFPENGDYAISLTVEDTFGASDTKCVDQSVAPGQLLLRVVAPKVLVVDQEVELLALFADPGWLDQHSVDWSTPGLECKPPFDDGLPVPAEELHDPSVGVGISKRLCVVTSAAGETISGSVTVSDLSIQDNGWASKSFSIDVVDHVPDLGDLSETRNDTPDTAIDLHTGCAANHQSCEEVLVSSIDSPTDVDFFKIDVSDLNVPVGSEVWLKLTGAGGNDVDLVVLADKNSVQAAPNSLFFRSPNSLFFRSPNSLFFRSPNSLFFRSPNSLFFRSPNSLFFRSPNSLFFRSPNSLFFRSDSQSGGRALDSSELWLSAWSYLLDLPDGTDISTMDVPQAEFGLGGLERDYDLVVRHVSANRDPNEQLFIRVGAGDQPLYVAVKGVDGAFTGEEYYTLQSVVATTPNLSEVLGSSCENRYVAANKNPEPWQQSGSPETLIVMAPLGRYAAAYGAVDTMKAALNTFAVNENAYILELGSDIYYSVDGLPGYDQSPCSVEAANRTATAIKSEILDKLNKYQSIENIVVLGADNMVPFYRDLDTTNLNERDYVLDSFLKPGTQLYASLFNGFTLTDHYFADDAVFLVNGAPLYTPKFAIGRLVERPTEIADQLSTGGVLAVEDALVTGYDFFREDAEATFNDLTGVVGPPLLKGLYSYSWSGDDLRCYLLGSVEDCDAGALDPLNGPADLVALNAHMAHYMLEAAAAYEPDHVGYDIVASTEYSDADMLGPPRAVVANGCHAGFSVPDGLSFSVPDDVVNELGINVDRDWPQELGDKGTALFASTGYGLGIQNGSAGTELLTQLIVKKATEGSSLGQALREAIEQYVEDQGTISDYDKKSLVQMTLYGMPTATLDLAAAPPPPAGGTPYGYLDLTIVDGSSSDTTSHVFGRTNTADGVVIDADGQTQATDRRPILPKIVKSLPNGEDVRGVLLLKSDAFRDISVDDPDPEGPPNPGNPVITLFTQDLLARDVDESDACLRSFWPSFPASLGLGQKLVILPAQFLCTGVVQGDAVGTLRLPSELTFEVLRAENDEEDVEPPLVREVKLRQGADENHTIVKVEARDTDTPKPNDPDDAEIRRIVVTVIDETAGTMESTDTGYTLTGAGPFEVTVNADFTNVDQRLLIQVVDDANNVTQWTNKGVYARGIKVDAAQTGPTQLTGTVYNFLGLLQAGATATDTENANIYYRWDFGDGTYESGTLAQGGQYNKVGQVDGPCPTCVDVDVDGAGNATFTREHQYDESVFQAVATLKVWTNYGGNGEDEVTFTRCWDGAESGDPIDPNGDLRLCGVENSGTQITVVLAIEGDYIADDWQYRLYLDLGANKSGGTLDDKSDLMLKYNGGQVTGLKSLVGEAVDNTLTLTFDLGELGWSGTRFGLAAETQKGVGSEPGTGFYDRLPEEGFLQYDLVSEGQ